LKEIDQYYLAKEEPLRSSMLALREIILKHDPLITEAWKYRMPFFCYRGKMFCYLWVNKKTNQPYLGLVEGNRIEHPLLIQEKRSRMKILLFDAETDLPKELIESLLAEAIGLYKSGVVKI